MFTMPTIDMVATGRNIMRLREAAGLTVRDLQDIFGFATPQAIYKWQKGKSLPSVDNLYALGALRRYAAVFGDTIKRVRMTIDQPRLDSYTTDEITVDELRAWGESIKPIAQRAFSGLGEFVPGDHCRFCRGKAQCRARAKVNTALEDFKDCVPAGSIPADAMVPQEHSHTGAVTGEEVHPLLSDEEIGDLLERGAQLVQWYKDLEAYATEALLAGKEIPGWKLVAGRSNRTFTDQDAAIQAVIAAGYDEALVYDRKPKTLSELEKLMGKAEFAEKIGGFVTKPLGKPTLAPASDKREAYAPAAAEFAGVVDG